MSYSHSDDILRDIAALPFYDQMQADERERLNVLLYRFRTAVISDIEQTIKRNFEIAYSVSKRDYQTKS